MQNRGMTDSTTPVRKPRRGEPRIVFDAPLDLIEQVKQRAVSRQSTVRTIMIEALKAYGFTVTEKDLARDRRTTNSGRRRVDV